MRTKACERRSRVRWQHGALLLALATSVACADARPPAEDLTALEKQGRALFADNCALCHGYDARGTGELPGMQVPAANLTLIAARRGGNFSSVEIALYIDGRAPVDAHRSPEMPVWGRVLGSEYADPKVREAVARGEISALVAYLRSIQVD